MIPRANKRELARNELRPDLRRTFDQLADEYAFHATVAHGRPWCAPKVLARLVEDGWRRSDGFAELLDDIDAYLDNRADVDEPEPGHKVANEEKRLLDRLREARA